MSFVDGTVESPFSMGIPTAAMLHISTASVEQVSSPQLGWVVLPISGNT